MLVRVRRYFLNMGAGYAVANLFVLGYLCFLIASAIPRRAVLTPIGLVLISICIALLVLPRFLMNVIGPHANRARSVLVLLSRGILLWMVARAIWKPPVPLAADLLLVAVVLLAHGTLFWLYSDPRLLTSRAVQRLLANADDDDEAAGDPSPRPPVDPRVTRQ